MTKADVLDYLEREQDARGIAHWEKRRGDSELRSYGIGLTRLRKYAKSLGRDAGLAKELWDTDVYEAKVLSLLVDDPKAMTIEQAETQVDQLQGGHLAHVFASCDATLAKTPFAVELMETWIESDEPRRRECGYGLLYEISKWKKKSAPDEAAFLAHIERIRGAYEGQPIDVLMSMGTALMGMGWRSKTLHAAAIGVAREIGPIDFDPDGRCDPFDVEKNLSNDVVTKRLGL